MAEPKVNHGKRANAALACMVHGIRNGTMYKTPAWLNQCQQNNNKKKHTAAKRKARFATNHPFIHSIYTHITTTVTRFILTFLSLLNMHIRPIEQTAKRDALIDIEKKAQKLWEDAKAFEVDAPTIEEHADMKTIHQAHPKFLSTTAYPYLNGRLHLGHGFTVSKIEFATGYQRLQGKRALFPLGWHCTGMPIRVSSIIISWSLFDRPKEYEEKKVLRSPYLSDLTNFVLLML